LNPAASLAREGPLLAEESFVTPFSARGNQRKKEIASGYRLPYLLLPVVTGSKFALVEPRDVGADLLQPRKELSGRRDVVVRIAHEDDILGSRRRGLVCRGSNGDFVGSRYRVGISLMPASRKLADEFPRAAGKHPGIRTEALEEEGEAFASIFQV